MITRRLFLFAFSPLLMPFRLQAAGEKYSAKTVSELIPRPADMGPDWHPIHPDRWLVTTPQKVMVFYKLRPPEGSAQKKDSVIVDIFVLKSATESAKMVAALRQKTMSIQGNVLRKAPELSKDAFISYYGPEAHFGQRVTFSTANLLITLPPSHNGMTVATKLLGKLRKR